MLCQKMSCCLKRKQIYKYSKNKSYRYENELSVTDNDEQTIYYNPYQYVDDKYNKKYYKRYVDMYNDL